jgi:hypothetical protein
MASLRAVSSLTFQPGEASMAKASSSPRGHTHPPKGKACHHHPKPFVVDDANGFFIIYGEHFNQPPRYHHVQNIVSSSGFFDWTWSTVEFTNNYIDIRAVPHHRSSTGGGHGKRTDDDISLTIELDDGSTDTVCICNVAITDSIYGKPKKSKPPKTQSASRAKQPKP